MKLYLVKGFIPWSWPIKTFFLFEVIGKEVLDIQMILEGTGRGSWFFRLEVGYLFCSHELEFLQYHPIYSDFLDSPFRYHEAQELAGTNLKRALGVRLTSNYIFFKEFQRLPANNLYVARLWGTSTGTSICLLAGALDCNCYTVGVFLKLAWYIYLQVYIQASFWLLLSFSV